MSSVVLRMDQHGQPVHITEKDFIQTIIPLFFVQDFQMKSSTATMVEFIIHPIMAMRLLLLPLLISEIMVLT